MRKLLPLLSLFIAFNFSSAQVKTSRQTFNFSSAQIKTPRQLFPGLFEAVQLSDIFPDNKTFVDATPRRDPEGL